MLWERGGKTITHATNREIGYKRSRVSNLIYTQEKRPLGVKERHSLSPFLFSPEQRLQGGLELLPIAVLLER